jgi:hypothetical protein
MATNVFGCHLTYMQFSDTSTNQGIIQDISFLLGVDLNNYLISDRTRNINERFRMVWQMIFESYGGWKWQDDNSNSNPYTDVDVDSGVATGALPTGALTIREAQIKDSNGVYHQIQCITEQEYFDMGGDSRWNQATAGQPQYLLPYEDTWRLLPAPNYTLSGALRIYFDADISTFAASDTTKVPGFASPFHRMLSIGASLDYALSRKMQDKVVYLQNLWNDYEKRLRDFYSKRYFTRYPARINPGHDLVNEYT